MTLFDFQVCPYSLLFLIQNKFVFCFRLKQFEVRTSHQLLNCLAKLQANRFDANTTFWSCFKNKRDNSKSQNAFQYIFQIKKLKPNKLPLCIYIIIFKFYSYFLVSIIGCWTLYIGCTFSKYLYV